MENQTAVCRSRSPYRLGNLATVGVRRGRPSLLGASGLTLIPLTAVVFNPIAFPLLVPAAIILARGFASANSWPKAAVISAVVSALTTFAAMGALLFHEDRAEWQTSGGSVVVASNVVTRAEVIVSLSLSAVAVAVALLVPLVAPDERTSSAFPRGHTR
jgi:hypothetical protein